MPSSSNNKKYVVGNTFSLKSFLLFVLFYLAGYFTSARNLELMQQLLESLLSNVTIFPRKVASVSSSIRVLDNDAPVELIMDVEECFNQLLSHLSPGGMSGDGKLLEPFEQLTLVLHRNGQAEACGETSGVNNFVVEIKNVLDEMRQQGLPCSFEKYQVESLLTRFFHKLAPTCHSEDEDRAAKDFGFYGFCDMGEAKTPILMDHQKLVYVKDGERSFLPCHFHNANGVRVTSLQQLTDFALRAVASNNNSKDCTTADEEEAKTCSASALRELHLYAVPAGRVFLHSAAYVGQIIDLPHVKGGDPDLPVCLEVLSISPAIFDLHNFFTKEESQNLVDRALAESKESHRIKRSTTGAVNGEVNERRTSESGFDTDGETSMLVKK